jgi:hypothetical protein
VHAALGKLLQARADEGRLFRERLELQQAPGAVHDHGEETESMTVAMLRDSWWWPWWVSSLIDLGVVAIAAAAFLASSRRSIRLIAAAVVLVGLVAAVMAPIVMTDDASDLPTMWP